MSGSATEIKATIALDSSSTVALSDAGGLLHTQRARNDMHREI